MKGLQIIFKEIQMFPREIESPWTSILLYGNFYTDEEVTYGNSVISLKDSGNITDRACEQ